MAVLSNGAQAESVLDQRDRSSVEARWETLRSAYLGGKTSKGQTPAPALPSAQSVELIQQPAVSQSRAAQRPAAPQWESTDEVTPLFQSVSQSEPLSTATPPSATLPVPTTSAVYSRPLVVEPEMHLQGDADAVSSQATIPVEEPAAETFVELSPIPLSSDWPADTVVQEPINAVIETPLLPTETAIENPFAGVLDLSEPVAEVSESDVDRPASPRPGGIDIDHLLPLKPLSDIVPSANYAVTEDMCRADGTGDDCPPDSALPTVGSPERFHGEKMYHWEASNLVYNPLYFEDTRLERYGQHAWGPLQSIKSVALFAGQFASLPYQMALDPVHECVSPLGFYRPGEAAPCLKRSIPWNGKALATSAGAYTGLIFLVP